MNKAMKASIITKPHSAVPKVITTVPVAGTVGDINVNTRTNRIYFVRSEAQVGVLDGRTNRIIAHIKTSPSPLFLAVNERTNRIYLTHFREGTVSVIDGQTNQVIAAVKVGTHPFGIAVNPRTNRIYVANLSGSISIIDGATNRVSRTLRIGGSPALVSINERTNRIYVTNVGKNTVSVINGLTSSVLATIKVGKNPIITPAINPITNRIYIANNLSRFVSVINGRANRLVRNIPLGRFQSELVINPFTNRIYVTSAQQSGAGKLFVINGHSNTVIEQLTLTVPTFTSIFINPRSNHLFVANNEGKHVSVYKGQTLERITTLRTGLNPGSITLNSRTNRLYIANKRSITVIRDTHRIVLCDFAVKRHSIQHRTLR